MSCDLLYHNARSFSQECKQYRFNSAAQSMRYFVSVIKISFTSDELRQKMSISKPIITKGAGQSSALQLNFL